jgi:hypothetical protein
MKRKKTLRIVLIVLASLFALYLIPSLYIGCRINQMVLQSYHSYGENNPYPETISDTHYSYLNCHLPEETARAKSESLHHTFPLTFFWPGGSKSVYWYTYKKVNPNGVSNTSKGGVIVTHQWKEGKWVITDVLAPEVPLCQYLFDAFFPY